jgi:hypothetical protein
LKEKYLHNLRIFCTLSHHPQVGRLLFQKDLMHIELHLHRLLHMQVGLHLNYIYTDRECHRQTGTVHIPRRHILRSDRFIHVPVDGSCVGTSFRNRPVRKEKEPDKSGEVS